MKLTAFILLTSAINVWASSGYSQTKKISLELHNRTVQSVLDEIARQSSFHFMYSEDFVDVDRMVSIKFENQKIDVILDQLFAGTEVKHRMKGHFILLTTDEKSEKEQNAVLQHSVSGTVTDPDGEPLSGVSIVVKGTNIGTTTDGEGNFSMLNVPQGSVLRFSLVGMVTKEVAAPSDGSYVNVRLEKDVFTMDEVVTVGYGTAKKSDLTGSIASIKAADIKNIPANSVAEAIQGKVAGVMISKQDGRPGANSDIIIRGVGSINGLSPLFVIDGIPRGGGVNYNLEDIESIEVIKDASAAAIYGAKAAGGVILMTTKKGKYDSKAQLNFSADVGVTNLTKSYDMLGTEDYIRARRAYGQNYSIWDNPASLPNTNWQDEMYKTGVEQNYNLSLTGGSQKIRYYLSTAYNREDGMEPVNYWERIAARLNVDYAVLKSLTIGTRIYTSRFRQNPYTSDIPWRTLPYMAVRNEDGTFASVPTGVEFSGGNPVAAPYLRHIKNGQLMTDVDLYVDWQIMKDLKLRVTGSGDLASGFSDTFTEDNNLGRTPFKGNYDKGLNYGESYTLNEVLEYAKVFAGKHDFKALVGYEARNYFGADLSATATDFPVNNPESFSLSSNDRKAAYGSLGRDRLISQFSRVSYAYDNRYLLNVNVRRDGNPKFGPKNRWGVFPSASVAWKIHEEPFFKNAGIDWVTSLKPRYSWGILGNDAALGAFAYKPSYRTITLHSFDETSATAGYGNVKVINEGIKWESIYNSDIGLDADFLEGRLSATFDYYTRKTKDMIYNLPTPLSAGITEKNQGPASMPVNIGRIDNKGWEAVVSWRNHVNEFTYSISGNISNNVNKVVDLGLPTAYIYAGGSYPFGAGGNQPFKTVNGEPIGMIWGLKTDGLISSQPEIDALNAKAVANGYDFYNRPMTGVGDLKFVDLDGDGRITNDDRTFIGNPWPKFIYGFTLNVEYKGFDLNANFVGVAKRDVFNDPKSFEQSFVDDFQSTSAIFNASFFSGNGLTDQPRIVATDPTTGAIITDPNFNYTQYSDYFVEDASYLKLKTLTLGYTIPASWLHRISVQNLRLYATANNLLTFTKFSGLDPEFVGGGKTSYGEYGIYNYPQTRMVLFGMNLTF